MSRKRYWKSLEEYRGDAALAEQAKDEFPAPLDPGVSRRAFIELAGLAAAAVALQSCKAPEQKIIPYVKQPVELTPGVANWYATTCGGCNAACGALARVCDGRPVKLEGNPEHPLSGGGLCAAAHAEVFNLYYAERLRQPLSKGKPASWDEIDGQVAQQLAAIRQSGGKVRLLTPSFNSPASKLACEFFRTRFVDTRHIIYQPISTSAIIAAHERTRQSAGSPDYHFEKAKLAVSFAADFLGTWGAPAPQMRGYSQARDLRGGRKEMLRHVQFESDLSLTGSNADRRVKVAPAEGFDALLYLAKLIATKNNSDAPFAAFEPKHLTESMRQAVEKTAEELQQRRGESLVVCGWNDVDAQSVVNFINHTLGNYGHTISTASGSERGVPLATARGTDSNAITVQSGDQGDERRAGRSVDHRGRQSGLQLSRQRSLAARPRQSAIEDRAQSDAGRNCVGGRFRLPCAALPGNVGRRQPIARRLQFDAANHRVALQHAALAAEFAQMERRRARLLRIPARRVAREAFPATNQIRELRRILGSLAARWRLCG
jgi:MoCo/4Fe-4S cofactor protein with predicted Tat translocation signal